MTVLDFDPPQSTLELAANNGPARRRVSRYRASAALYGDARVLYREVLQAALAAGQRIDADSLRVVLSTKQSLSAAPIRSFTGGGIWQLMFVDVVAWCRTRKLDVPERCAHALSVTIAHLEATQTLDEASDDADELFDAIDECTGGWTETHPSSPGGSRRSLRSERGPQRS